MKRKTLVIGLTLLLAVALSGSVYAIPQLIDYQGKLLNADETPPQGPVSINFRIYNAGSGGTPLWSETHTSVTVDIDTGLFNVFLGSIQSLSSSVLNGSNRWLGIEVDSDGEMSPRKQIASVAHAYQADNATNAINAINATSAANATNADKLDNHDSTYFIDTSSDLQTKTGPLDIDGAVFIDDYLTVEEDLTVNDDVFIADDVDIGTDDRNGSLDLNGYLSVEGTKAGYLVDIDQDGTGVALNIDSRSVYPNPILDLDCWGDCTLAMRTDGDVEINGNLYLDGSQVTPDYVFEDDYKLESIEEHSKFMWQEKHLPAVPAAKTDENGGNVWEVGAQSMGVLEELEKAHIYIENLNNKIKKLEDMMGKLEMAKTDADKITRK